MDTGSAEGYLRQLAETERPHILAVPRNEPAASGNAFVRARPEPQGLRRVRAAAAALVAVGALDERAGQSIVTDLESAFFPDGPAWQGMLRAPFRRPPRLATVRSGGILHAIGVGATIPVEVSGRRWTIQLLTLVLAADQAVLTVIGRAPAESAQAGRDAPELSITEYLTGTAIDDRGDSYRVQWGAYELLGGMWDGHFTFYPVPPAGLRWLDVTLALGTPAVRITLDAALTATPATGPSGDASAAERFLDTAAERLLASRSPREPATERHIGELADELRALQAIGTLPPDSQALRRLTTLARRLGYHLPPELADVPETSLPEPWTSVLSDRDRSDGPIASSPIAAVIPGPDGAACALAGLWSGRDSATLYVVADGWGWGWQSSTPRRWVASLWDRYSWWAHDNAGRWHLARDNGGTFEASHAVFRLELKPALHPDATTLDVILTGPSGQMSATMPLQWSALP